MEGALLNDPPDEMVAHINVLYAHVVLMITGEHDCCLVVREEGSGGLEGAEELSEETVQPER